MAISLGKGENISLSKTDPGLRNALLGLGWNVRASVGEDFDLDASVFMLGDNGKVASDAGIVFYGQLASPCESVVHTGDNRTGEGDGDDEAIHVFLDKVPADIVRLVIAVTIHEAETRRQNFGMVQDAFVRLVNLESDNEVVRFDLSEDYSNLTALIVGEIYRRAGEWKFKAVGQGYAGGLHALCIQHGLDVT